MTKKKEIFRVLNELAIPCSIKGRELLESSIEYIMEHGRTNFSRELYPYLSRTFNLSTAAIERSIYVAVGICANKSDIDTLDDIFGNVYGHDGSLTVQNFIYGVVRYLKLQEEEV